MGRHRADVCSLCAFGCLIAQNCLLAYLAVLLLGTAYVLIQSVLASNALTLAPLYKGLSSGLVGVGVFGGGGLGTWIGSLLLKQAGYVGLFSCFAALTLVIVAFVCRYARRILD